MKGICAILDLPQFRIGTKWNSDQLERCDSAQADWDGRTNSIGIPTFAQFRNFHHWNILNSSRTGNGNRSQKRIKSRQPEKAKPSFIPKQFSLSVERVCRSAAGASEACRPGLTATAGSLAY